MWEAGGSRAQPSFGEAETLWQVLCSAFHILALGKLGHSWFRQCLSLLCTLDYFNLPSACEWNVVGVERQHRKAEYSAAWTLSVEAWKLGLDWYGSSTLHAATVGFILKPCEFVNACQTLPLVTFVLFFVQTYPATFHSSSSNSQQLLLASAGHKETLHEEIQQVHIFSLGVHGCTRFKKIGWKAWNLWNNLKTD